VRDLERYWTSQSSVCARVVLYQANGNWGTALPGSTLVRINDSSVDSNSKHGEINAQGTQGYLIKYDNYLLLKSSYFY